MATEDLFQKCVPAIALGRQNCGAFTEYDISATGANQLDAIYSDEEGKFRVLGGIIQADLEGNMCQIRQNSLATLIDAMARPMDTRKLDFNNLPYSTKEIRPFVMIGRNGPINNNYWNVTTGAPSAAFTAPALPVPAAAPDPTLGNYDYSFRVVSQTGIPPSIDWFPPRSVIMITSQGSGGTTLRTNWKVIQAVASSTYVTIYAFGQNTESALAENQVTYPATGVAIRVNPNVDGYEAYCAQQPSLNTRQMYPAFFGETRVSWCMDDQVEKYYAALRANNPFFKEFGEVETVVRNKQILEGFKDREANSFFFEKALPNQNINDWGLLEPIKSIDGSLVTNYLNFPGIFGRNMGRRANPVGIYEQLAACGSVFDLQGLTLNLAELFEKLYLVNRVRKDNGNTSNVIEVVTDSAYAIKLRQGLLRYKKNRFEGLLQINEPINGAQSVKTKLGFNFTDIELDRPAGVILRIVTSEALDDWLDAHKRASGGISNSGRMLLFLDLGNSIYKSVIESATVTHKSADIEQMAAINGTAFCAMKLPSRSIKLMSVKRAYIVDCPMASIWMEGIADAVPEHCGVSGDPLNLGGAV